MERTRNWKEPPKLPAGNWILNLTSFKDMFFSAWTPSIISLQMPLCLVLLIKLSREMASIQMRPVPFAIKTVASKLTYMVSISGIVFDVALTGVHNFSRVIGYILSHTGRMPPLWRLPFGWREDMCRAFSTCKWSSHNANEASNLSDLVITWH